MTQRDWLILAILTFLFTSAWVTLEVYHSYTRSTVSKVDEALMVPITPQFDHDTIVKLVDENQAE